MSSAFFVGSFELLIYEGHHVNRLLKAVLIARNGDLSREQSVSYETPHVSYRVCKSLLLDFSSAM